AARWRRRCRTPARTRRPWRRRPFLRRPLRCARSCSAAPARGRRLRSRRGLSLRRGLRAPGCSRDAPAGPPGGHLVDQLALVPCSLELVLAAAALAKTVEHLVLGRCDDQLLAAVGDLGLRAAHVLRAAGAVGLDALEERLARPQLRAAERLGHPACIALVCARPLHARLCAAKLGARVAE